MEIVASLSQGRTVVAQCCLFTHKSVPVIFEPPCMYVCMYVCTYIYICMYVCMYVCMYACTLYDKLPESYVVWFCVP